MGGLIDAARHPTLAAYVAGLPDGLDSYPACRSKGTLVRSSLDGHDLTAVAPSLPDLLRNAIESPPLVSEWVPAVLSDAMFHLVCDTFYPSDAQMCAWTRRRSTAMMATPANRVLLRLIGPRLSLKSAAMIHSQFQKGTHLIARTRSDGGRATLTHPPYLHSRLNHLSNVPGFTAILVATGTADVACEMTSSTATEAIYEFTWRS